MRNIGLLSALCIWSTMVMGQGFLNQLPEGVYLSFESFRSGKPEIRPDQLTNGHQRQLKVRTWFRGDSLFVLNPAGAVRKLAPDSVYALVSDGELYLQRKGLDHKVTLRGELLFFTESYPVRNMAMSPVVLDRTRNQIPRILDFRTGDLLEYSVNTMEAVLMERDAELYQEFQALSSLKTKRQVLFRFIEKYNERHPVPSPRQL